MLVANSFDLWQKDTFFSAAEEVQQSADIMESAYRSWVKAKREALMPHHLEELSRELQMALGTAKWQLEEFERAVRSSYRSHGDDITISRHQQFVSVIEEQISHVETAFKESFNAEGKRPFRWVNLDEQECDDLALFLSGSSEGSTDDSLAPGPPALVATSSFTQKNSAQEDVSNFGTEVSSKIQIASDGKSLQEQEESRYEDDRIASHRRTWSSPNVLEIVIDKDDREMNAVIEATPKEKGSKPFFWSSRGEERVRSLNQFKIINWINQRLRGVYRSQRQQQVSAVSPVASCRSCSIRLKPSGSPSTMREKRDPEFALAMERSSKWEGFVASSLDIIY